MHRRDVHTEFVAERVDEVTTTRVVPLLEALPAEEASYYAKEENAVEMAGKSWQHVEELERQCGFFGGEMDLWISYLHREDLPPGLWVFKPRCDVMTINGVSAVLKKDGHKLRKLIMAVPTNFLWSDVRRRGEHGLGGGGALAKMRAKRYGVTHGEV